ncbi:ribbon-helix-helix protein, CopG family [Spiribacter vilamensis]|uniref:Ribbon-helix-helix CopG family protein n=1 Tax=Spiribacter vilamensis TaxID=531306 RepID=A0A4Q8D070_9GAMM|nr:ribbon-helix-helix protein, CopG family [Spiribacter vilamensis]RZU98711.1 ribbon-helix-helix CopG family protein [Spiribacter vilamensis]TVO62263.1 ribbon-helix-helix protein, CopG family [Spiribacter vilamensis]
MSRLTITLDDDLHRALKEAAARQGRSIGNLIEESLQLRGIKPTEDAQALVERARHQAQMDEEAALTLATAEVRDEREEQPAASNPAR